MVKIVRQAEQLAASLGHQSMHWLRCFEKTLPGGVGNFSRKRGGARPAVEGVVPGPQRQPLLIVVRGHGPDGEGQEGIIANLPSLLTLCSSTRSARNPWAILKSND